MFTYTSIVFCVLYRIIHTLYGQLVTLESQSYIIIYTALNSITDQQNTNVYTRFWVYQISFKTTEVFHSPRHHESNKIYQH